MKYAARGRQAISLIVSITVLLITLSVVWFYLIKPWPGVETSNNWTLVNPPVNGLYKPGEVIAWTKPRVCTPEGTTTVQFLATRQYPPGAYDFLMYTRFLRYSKASCNTPNTTRIIVPPDLQSGTYDIMIRACTDTPNPRDTCVEAEGPRFNLLNTTFGSTPSDQ